jgi:hypothetical protein
VQTVGAQASGTSLGDLSRDLAVGALAMARGFAGGSTLWCVAPEWPAHAHHVAVEFVHPVIVGKRALPAVAVQEPDPVSALRPVAGSGDLLLAVARSTDERVAALLRRAPAWGLRTFWIGGGPRPGPGAADHVLWLADDGRDDELPYSGRLVLVYHLLWELTHVCFEHPGLLRDGAACRDEVCITCSDDARLGEVVEVRGSGEVVLRTARGRETADASLIADAGVGDLLLVHAGTAVERVEGR